MRTLGSILATDSTADVTRLGWPTLRAGFPLMTVLNSLREMRAVLARRAGDGNPARDGRDRLRARTRTAASPR